MPRFRSLIAALVAAAIVSLPALSAAAKPAATTPDQDRPSAGDLRKRHQGLGLAKQSFNRVSFGLLARQEGLFNLEIKNRSVYIIDVAVIKVFFFDPHHKFLSRAYGLLYNLAPGKTDQVRLVNFYMQPRESKYFYVSFAPISMSYSQHRRVDVTGYSDYQRMLYPVYHQRGKYLPLPGCGECEKDFGWLF